MKSVQLSIPEPCHENWQDMTPNDQGRFCNSCAKTVVDFSMMTDTEVLNYFSNLTNEKVCGRALPAQLNRTIRMPKEPKKRLFWYWNYIMMFFMFFSKSNHVKAQTKGQVVTVPVIKPSCNVWMGKVYTPQQVKLNRDITGKVTSTEGKPVSFATIKIKGTRHAVIADVNGVFTIKASEGDDLEFTSTNFESQCFTINKNIVTVDVQLKRFTSTLNTIIMGATLWIGDRLGTKPQSDKILEIIVIDEKNNKPVINARVTNNKSDGFKPDTAFTDRTGSCKVKKIQGQDFYLVRVSANGYRDNAVTIKVNELNEKNAVKEILLTKIIENDYKNLDSVIVRAPLGLQREPREQGVAQVTFLDTTKINRAKKIINNIADKITLVTNANTIKVYPNPVSRGNAIFISLKLQRAGDLAIQISDITERVILQKQVNTSGKEFMGKMETDSRWAGGMYFISVFSSNAGQAGKLIGKVSFIIQ